MTTHRGQPGQADGETPEPHIPRPFAERLRAAANPGSVPPEVDAAVLATARRRLAPHRGSGRRLRLALTAASLAAAAGLALAAWVVWPSIGRPAGGVSGGGRSIAQAPSLPGDINGDGRVDIVDALLLAEALRDGRDLPAAWDVNGDGRVTQADVDAIARTATSLRIAGDGPPRAREGGAS